MKIGHNADKLDASFEARDRHRALLIAGYLAAFIYVGTRGNAATIMADANDRVSVTDRGFGDFSRYNYDKTGNRLSRVVESNNRRVRVDVAGAGGNATGGGVAAVGAVVNLHATPFQTTDFADWSINGSVVGRSEFLSFNVPSGAPAITLVTARFVDAIPASISFISGPQTLNVGSFTTFSAIVGGTGTLVHQWFRNGVELPGETSATLTLSSISFNDAGLYSIRVSNRHGADESSPSLLSVRMAGYDDWKSAVFSPSELTLNDPNVVAPSAILNGTMPNLLRYAFGIRTHEALPLGSVGQGVQSEGGARFFTFRYRQLLGGGGLRYTPAVSDNLSAWDVSQSQIEGVGAPIPNGDGLTETVTVRLRSPLNDHYPKKFIRLEVSAP